MFQWNEGGYKTMRQRRRNQRKRGFTLTEIMIVSAIISLLAVIATPYWRSAVVRTHTATCLNNLRQIDGAKDRYAIEHNNQEPASLQDLFPDFVKSGPQCPASGEYTINSVGVNPTCSIGDPHVLP